MLEATIKKHYPLLPFFKNIRTLEIKAENSFIISSNDLSSKDFNDSSETDFEGKYDNDFPKPTFLNFDKNNNQKLFNNAVYPIHKKKSPVKMNESASNFKFAFYQIFTTRKKFPKKYVVLIHNEICNNLNIRKVARDETRSINLYFADFAKHQEKILYYIKTHKNSIIQSLPELKEIIS